MALHAFVAMPFGVKEGVDFNKVYRDYIKPALESADFEVFRADEEMRAGNIRTDMFQELLLADLVVVDLSIDNPNVWYELGVRHALRARGVIQVQCRRDHMPFDVYTDRVLRYHIKEGVLDPDSLEKDKANLSRMAKETMASWRGRKISPVYHHLRYLQEPDWKSLRLEEAKEFWEKEDEWERLIEVARRKQRPGDILVLADEGPTWVLRHEAHRTAGKALRELGQFSFALEEIEKALDINPDDIDSRREKGILLNRLGKFPEAKEWLKKLVKDHPEDAESWALLGRIEKDEWVRCWNETGKRPEERRACAADEECLLEEVIKTYATGFRLDPGHYYSGINALTLLHLYKDLTDRDVEKEDLKAMEGGVRWAVHSALTKDAKDYWAKVTLGDVEVLVSDADVITRTYKEAVAIAEEKWFALDSPRQQLMLLENLGFRPPQVAAAIKVFDKALERLGPPKKKQQPRFVFLFSGHMIDAPNRVPSRFPADKEKIAAEAIAKKLDELGAGSEDVALCGGACGGDLLFAEFCLKRGMRLEIRIPFDEPTFLKESVTFAKDNWQNRFYAVKENPLTKLFQMPEEIGPTPEKVNPFERNNLWQLHTALAWGPEKVRFICLWNGRGGDGPGGTKHMHDTVLEHSGWAYILDTTKLW